MHYAQPTGNATAFDQLNAIKHAVSNTNVSSLGDLAIRMNEGATDGLRQTQWDISLKVDRSLFTYLTDTFYTIHSEIPELADISPVISIQAITDGQLNGMQKNGGNALGLDPTKGPYFVMNMSAKWSNATDDAAVLRFFPIVIEQVKAEARRRGLDNDYIYMNYASQFEDPIASYGAANVERLLGISRKYDPTGVFQNLHPGHFKLAQGPPNTNMP